MDTIYLKDIKIYAYHGCLTEEGQIGSNYIINLKVSGDFSQSAKTDLLKDTVDYVHLNRIIKEEMGIRSKLLETVGKRIMDRILMDFKLVNKVSVSVSKLNPPIGGDVKEVAVILKRKR